VCILLLKYEAEKVEGTTKYIRLKQTKQLIMNEKKKKLMSRNESGYESMKLSNKTNNIFLRKGC